MESSDTSHDPRADLALIRQVRERLDPPPGFALAYDVLFGVLLGAFVGAQALPPMIRPYATVLALLLCFGLMTWWKRKLGWWVGGYSPRHARWVSIGLAAVMIGLMAWVWLVGSLWVALTAGILAGCIAFLAGRAWTATWRRERAAVEASR